MTSFIITTMNANRSQKGAALIIVLLLVATLSVIAVGLTDQTLLASARARNEHARSQMFWRVTGAEALAGELLSQAFLARNDGVMSIDDFWAVQPFDLTALFQNEQEEGSVQFTDGSRCFNLNSLFVDDDAQSGNLPVPLPASGTPSATPVIPLDEQRITEFATVLFAIGISDNDARQLAIIIRDWIDPDGDPGPGGAEDNTYLRLPVPYRTGNTLLADESELRAMIGVDPVLMSVIAPFICALPTAEPAIVNVNMLRLQDAPVLAGVFGGVLSLSDAELIIERRPSGGYQSINDIQSLPFLAGIAVDPGIFTTRLSVRSSFLQARMNLQYGKTLLRSTMLFSVDLNNRVTLISRRFGS